MEPLVRKAAFLFVPARAFLCLRMILVFLVLDATVTSLLKF